MRVGLLMLDQMFGFYCTAAVQRDQGKHVDELSDRWMDGQSRQTTVRLTSF